MLLLVRNRWKFSVLLGIAIKALLFSRCFPFSECFGWWLYFSPILGIDNLPIVGIYSAVPDLGIKQPTKENHVNPHRSQKFKGS